jgi:hypothetical protein
VILETWWYFCNLCEVWTGWVLVLVLGLSVSVSVNVRLYVFWVWVWVWVKWFADWAWLG